MIKSQPDRAFFGLLVQRQSCENGRQNQKEAEICVVAMENAGHFYIRAYHHKPQSQGGQGESPKPQSLQLILCPSEAAKNQKKRMKPEKASNIDSRIVTP